MLELKTAAALALVSILTAGCVGDQLAGGTGVGNPVKGSVTVAMQAVSGSESLAKTAAPRRNSDGSFTVADAAGTQFTIRSSYANVGSVKLKLPDGIACSQADETECESDRIKIKGPFSADLMTGEWQPNPGVFRIPVGSYSTLTVQFEPMDKDQSDGGTGLQGHTLLIQGTFAYAGKDAGFSLALDFNEEAEYVAAGGLGVTGKGLDTLLVLLNADQWLSQADITACLDSGKLVLDPAGNLAVDKSDNCPGLENAIKDAVKGSGKLRDHHD
jgi:hypothetical protein